MVIAGATFSKLRRSARRTFLAKDLTSTKVASEQIELHSSATFDVKDCPQKRKTTKN